MVSPGASGPLVGRVWGGPMSDREQLETSRAYGLRKRHETRLRRADLVIVRAAIEMLPATCKYHGDELLRGHGPWRDEACCDTGKPALARRKAEEALRRLEP